MSLTPQVSYFIPGSSEDTDKYIEVTDGHYIMAKKTGQVQIKMCDNNGDPFIATLHRIIFSLDLCDGLFSIITSMNLRHTGGMPPTTPTLLSLCFLCWLADRCGGESHPKKDRHSSCKKCWQPYSRTCGYVKSRIVITFVRSKHRCIRGPGCQHTKLASSACSGKTAPGSTSSGERAKIS